jgi:hypothetical protein
LGMATKRARARAARGMATATKRAIGGTTTVMAMATKREMATNGNTTGNGYRCLSSGGGSGSGEG